MEAADVILLNTCHIREKAAEKVYSDLGRIRQVKDARAQRRQGHHRRGGRLRRPGRGRRDRAPRAGRRSGRRPAELSPAGRAHRPRPVGSGAGSSRPAFPRRTSSAALPERARPQGGDGVPHRAGGLRQVLHLLRRALHARRRVLAARRRRGGRGPPPRRPRRARDHAARPERQRLSRPRPRRPPVVAGAADRPAGRDRRHRAHPLHHQPSRAT